MKHRSYNNVESFKNSSEKYTSKSLRFEKGKVMGSRLIFTVAVENTPKENPGRLKTQAVKSKVLKPVFRNTLPSPYYCDNFPMAKMTTSLIFKEVFPFNKLETLSIYLQNHRNTLKNIGSFYSTL